MKFVYIMSPKLKLRLKKALIGAAILSFFLAIISVSNYVYLSSIYNAPANSTNVNTIDEVIPGGDIVGIKLFSNGVIVTGFEQFETDESQTNEPYKYSNIKEGDIITKVNGTAIENVKHLLDIVDQAMAAGNESIGLTINRQGKELETAITPEMSKIDGRYKLGLWVKDSMAGLGTITFIDKKTKHFVSLGHGITETNNDTMIPVWQGNIVKTSINEIVKSKVKSPGEIVGTLIKENLGTIEKNFDTGTYGTVMSDELLNKQSIKVAKSNEIKVGKAKILSAIDGEVKSYNIKIVKIFHNSQGTKNMIIEITDKALLDKTGGIVQGMSGSPIIQNNKLVGAVTHVFVNNPKQGYGSFISNMINDMISMD